MTLKNSKKLANDYVIWLYSLWGVKCVPDCPFTLTAMNKLVFMINDEITRTILEKENG